MNKDWEGKERMLCKMVYRVLGPTRRMVVLGALAGSALVASTQVRAAVVDSLVEPAQTDASLLSESSSAQKAEVNALVQQLGQYGDTGPVALIDSVYPEPVVLASTLTGTVVSDFKDGSLVFTHEMHGDRDSVNLHQESDIEFQTVRLPVSVLVLVFVLIAIVAVARRNVSHLERRSYVETSGDLGRQRGSS